MFNTTLLLSATSTDRLTVRLSKRGQASAVTWSGLPTDHAQSSVKVNSSKKMLERDTFLFVNVIMTPLAFTYSLVRYSRCWESSRPAAQCPGCLGWLGSCTDLYRTQRRSLTHWPWNRSDNSTAQWTYVSDSLEHYADSESGKASNGALVA